MNNEENYKELRSVIDSLPNWITLNDTSAFDENENEEFTDEESEYEDEFSDEYDEIGCFSSVSFGVKVFFRKFSLFDFASLLNQKF